MVSKSPEWLLHAYVRKSAFKSCCGRNASGATAASNLGMSLGGYQISNTLILPWHLHTQQHPGGSLWVSFLPAVSHYHFCPGKPAQDYPWKKSCEGEPRQTGFTKGSWGWGGEGAGGQGGRKCLVWFIFYLDCPNISQSLYNLWYTAVQ